MRKALVTTTALALTAVTLPAVAQDRITVTPAAALEWSSTPEAVAFAPLVGDRFSGAYMAMVRLPAGTVSPAHVKTAEMFGVVVSGSMSHVAEGDDPAHAISLSAGSFYRIPAGVPHVSRCLSADDCVTFLYQDGRFDFLPTHP